MRKVKTEKSRNEPLGSDVLSLPGSVRRVENGPLKNTPNALKRSCLPKVLSQRYKSIWSHSSATVHSVRLCTGEKMRNVTPQTQIFHYKNFFTTDLSKNTYVGNLEEKNIVPENEVHFVELEVLAKLESTKAKGNVGFRNDVLKRLSIVWGKSCFAFNINCKKHVFLAVWKTGTIVPIYKDGDKQWIDRYRGIVHPRNVSEVLEKKLFNRFFSIVQPKKFFSNTAFEEACQPWRQWSHSWIQCVRVLNLMKYVLFI